MSEAIVLAGGLGTRLRAVVSDLPKPMAPIAGRPFLDILLTSLARKGISRVILALGYRASCISEHFGEAFAGMRLEYSVESAPLGTGGALRLALQQCREDHALVLNGDTWLDIDIAALEAQWSRRRQAIIVGRWVTDTTRYGLLHVQDGMVCGLGEKSGGGPGLVNAGCYVLRREQLDAWSPGVPFSLERDYFVPALAGTTAFDLFVTDGQFIDIGVPEDYRRAQQVLATR